MKISEDLEDEPGTSPPGSVRAGEKAGRRASRRGWALILGASSGFGAATALALGREGHDIIGVHLDPRSTRERARALESRLRELGCKVYLFNENAARPETIDKVLDRTGELLGPGGARVRVLLHSLAFGALAPLLPAGKAGQEPVLRPRQLGTTMEVMAHSLVWWTRGLVERDLLGLGSRVLALTSAGSLRVLPDYGAVSAAKAALEAHVRQLAVELGPRGITVNALRAGITDTPALRRIPDAEQILAQAARRNPCRRLTRVDDLAQLVVAMLHPGFDWVTGNVIGVDGGETLPA